MDLVLALSDEIITISDAPERIISVIKKAITYETQKNPDQHEEEALSERETEVIKLMTAGLTDKEIADRFNISINTVITHRKNISWKSGIKSISGLTIYAVVKKLVPMNNLH